MEANWKVNFVFSVTYIIQNINNPQNKDYSAVYDYSYYLARNPDVASAYGGGEAATFRHFKKYGMAEGRRGSSAFDPKEYRARYTDLDAAYGGDWQRYYDHYIRRGRQEGRSGRSFIPAGEDYSAVYDYSYYLARNPDVASAYGGGEAATFRHFKKYGMAEGRRGSSAFDPKEYRARYTDLDAAYGGDWQRYYDHYIRRGRQEGRSGRLL